MATTITLSRFRSGLSPEAVDEALRTAVSAEHAAEASVVLWFTEVTRRRLHRALGYGTSLLYATERLGFSASKAYQLIRIAEAMGMHATLREAIASGTLEWTKAREILPIVTRASVDRWVDVARRVSRKELVRRVAASKAHSRVSRRQDPAQAIMGCSPAQGHAAPATPSGGAPGPSVPGPSVPSASVPGASVPELGRGGEPAPANSDRASALGDTIPTVPPLGRRTSSPDDRVPHAVSLRFDPLALARFEGLLAALERAGVRGPREQLVADGLEALLAAHDDARRSATGREGIEREVEGAERQVEGVEREVRRAEGTGGERVGSARVADDFHSRASAAHATRTAPAASARGFTPHQGARSPYQVTIRLCPSCGQADVATSRGDRAITRAELMAKLVDADIIDRGRRRRASISPRMRRAVLERDNYMCRAPGCRRRHGLTVHHEVPVEGGGANTIDNYRTLCDRCHPALHAAARRSRRLRVKRSRALRSASEQ